MAAKIIVLGDVNGQLSTAFKKLATLHSKNNFSFALVAGNLFAENDTSVDDLLTNTISVPLPTYFTVGSVPLPQRIVDKISNDTEICPNLLFLGKRSITKTSEGIRIVTLGGQVDSTIIAGLSKDRYLPLHTLDDAKSLRGANTADILLTTAWPASVRAGSKIPIPDTFSEPSGLEHISDLCAILKPRYHFSVSDFFYEREPFFHNSTSDTGDSRPLTRFISLAPQGNSAKQKSLYAFSFQQSVDPTAPLPAGTTASPFQPQSSGNKRAIQDTYSRFSSSEGSYHRKRGKGHKGQRQPPPSPGECFFCLSNPNIATHLISSIGEDSYLTIAKGPLTTPETNASAGIDFPAHALIIPLTHAPTIALMADEPETAEKTYSEMTKFREALQKMIAKRSSNKLGSVTYEISKATGIHTHWQFLPVPEDMIRKGLVEAAFHVEAENLAYPRFSSRDPRVGKDEGDFFRVWIWAPLIDNKDGSTKCLTLSFDDNIRFSLQFGRAVLAKLLGLEKRMQWRDCGQTEEEEKRDITAFKTAFVEFDFTL